MGGLLGLVLAMVMETLLIIIRCSAPQHLPLEKAARQRRGSEGAQMPHPTAAAQAGPERDHASCTKTD